MNSVVDLLTFSLCAGLILYEASDSFRFRAQSTLARIREVLRG